MNRFREWVAEAPGDDNQGTGVVTDGSTKQGN